MATVRELIVSLGVETDEDEIEAFSKKVEKGEKRVKELAEQLDKLEKEFGKNGDATKEQNAALSKLSNTLDAAKDDTAKYKRELNKLEKAKEDLDGKFSALDKGISSLSEGFGKAAKAAAAFFAGVAAGSAVVVSAVKSTARYSEEILRAAASLGAATGKMQQFRFAFRALGASPDDLMDAFATVTDRATDAVEGSKTYAKEFRRIGVAVSELRGKKPAELLEMIFKKTKKIGDETKVVTAMVRLFGDDLGRRLMPALTGSAESFDEMFKMARKAGLILDKRLIKSGQLAQIAFRKLEAVLLGLWREFGARLAPAFDELADMLVKFIMGMRESGKVTDLLKNIVRIITGQLFKFADAASSVWDLIGGLNGALNVFKIGLVAVSAVLAAIAGFGTAQVFIGLKTIVVALASALGIATAKLLAIIAAIAALALYFEDLWNYAAGNNSIFGTLAKDAPVFRAILDALVMTFKVLGRQLKALWIAIKGLFGSLIDAVVEVFAPMQILYNLFAELFGLETSESSGLMNVLNVILGVLNLLITGIVTIVAGFTTLLTVIVQFVEGAVRVLTFFSKTIYDLIFGALTGSFGDAFDRIDKRSDKFISDMTGLGGEFAANLGFGEVGLGEADAAVAAEQRAQRSTATNTTNTSSTKVENNEFNMTAPATDNPEEFGQRAMDAASERKQARSSIAGGER